MTSPMKMLGALLLVTAACGRADAQNLAYSCIDSGLETTGLTYDQVFTLCGGSSSLAPVGCYVAADRELRLSEQQAITLCQGASSTAPVGCFEETDDKTNMSSDQILEVCSQRQGLVCIPAGSF